MLIAALFPLFFAHFASFATTAGLVLVQRVADSPDGVDDCTADDEGNDKELESIHGLEL